MTYKIYGIGAVAIAAIIIALAYNPAPQYDFNEIITNEISNNPTLIVTTIQQSEQWDWLKKQVENAEESKRINTLESTIESKQQSINALEYKISGFNKRINDLETFVINQRQVEPLSEPIVSSSDEITLFYTADNDGDREDEFDQGDIVYFYATVDTREDYLYYEIVNDDDNDEVKDKRLTISRDSNQLVWAWVIPSDQDKGDYYIEIEVGDTTKKVYFEIE